MCERRLIRAGGEAWKLFDRAMDILARVEWTLEREENAVRVGRLLVAKGLGHLPGCNIEDLEKYILENGDQD